MHKIEDSEAAPLVERIEVRVALVVSGGVWALSGAVWSLGGAIERTACRLGDFAHWILARAADRAERRAGHGT